MKKSFCLFLMILLAISMFVGCNPSPKVLKSITVTNDPTVKQYWGCDLDTSGVKITGNYSDGSTQLLSKDSFRFDPSRLLRTTGTDNVTVYVIYEQDSSIYDTFVITPITPVDAVKSISVAQNPTKTEYVSGDQLNLEGLVIGVKYDSGKETTITDGFTTEPKNGATLSTSEREKKVPVTVTYGGQQTSFTITVKPVAIEDTTLGAKDSWFTTLVAGDIATKNEIVAIEFTTGLDLPKETVFRVKDVDLTEKKTGLVKGYITEDYKVYVVGQTITANADSEGMFAGFTSMKTFKADNLNTKNVTDMSSMFDGCKDLEKLTFGDTFNTSSVTKMHAMFRDCSSLKELDVSTFDTKKVLEMSSMFNGCKSLGKLLDEESEEYGELTFGDDFDTSRVVTMIYMFKDCSSLKGLDLSSFDTSRTLFMSAMFDGCEKLEKLNLGDDFDIPLVLTMGAMFRDCASLKELDLSNWKTGKVLMNVSWMFDGCRNLKKIYVSEDFKIPSDALDIEKAMFKDCLAIEGGNGTGYRSSKTSKDYAIIDGTDGKEGYLTDVRVKHVIPKASDLWGEKYFDLDQTFMGKIKSVLFADSIKPAGIQDKSIDLTDGGTVKGYIVYNNTDDLKSKKNPRICITGKLIVLNPDCSNMFTSFTSMNNVQFEDVVDTSYVTDMSSMFRSCTDLQDVDLRRFNTSNVTKMDGMFCGCLNLTDLDLSSFDVTTKRGKTPSEPTTTLMFDNCGPVGTQLTVKVNISSPNTKDRWNTVLNGFTQPSGGSGIVEYKRTRQS